MLTIPNEIVPLQIARGVRGDFRSRSASLRPPLGEGAVGAVLRAVLGAIPNIKGITIGAGSGADWDR